MADHDTQFLRASSTSCVSRVDALLLERTRGRLVAVALLVSVIAMLALVVINFAPGFEHRQQSETLGTGNPGLVAQILSSLLLAILVWRRMVPVRLMFVLGMIYEVWLCWNASIEGSRELLVVRNVLPLVTFTEVIIVFFPLVVPNKPRFVVAAATLSAATKPLAVWVISRRYGVELPDNWWFPVAFAPLVATIMALFGAKVIYGLGLAVAEAQRMGSYRLEHKLGSGGMGEVWRAKHTLLVRPAAVKFIRPALAHAEASVMEQMVERFEREAQATSLLQSPHTVRLFDFGRESDGTFYYVMEMLDGLTLRELVERFGPTGPSRARYFIGGICHSLSEAHANGLAHRDVKPENIMVCRAGLDADVIKVLDFGLVGPRQGAGDSPSMTAVGTIGTPAFISPEAARGEPIDHRADIYAIGCLWYWLLAGRLVFEEQSAMAMGVAHASKAPPPLDELCEDELPEGLVAVVAKCLEKDPNVRYQAIEDITDDLEGIVFADDWTQKRAQRWWDRHRPLDATSVAVSPST